MARKTKSELRISVLEQENAQLVQELRDKNDCYAKANTEACSLRDTHGALLQTLAVAFPAVQGFFPTGGNAVEGVKQLRKAVNDLKQDLAKAMNMHREMFLEREMFIKALAAQSGYSLPKPEEVQQAVAGGGFENFLESLMRGR